MRVRDVARALDVSPSLVYALLTSGKLRGTRHGLGRGTWRVSDEQLRDYLERATAQDGPRAASPSMRL